MIARSQAASSAYTLGNDGPTTILVGVDGSESAWRALHYAVGLARRQASRLVGVYANQLPVMSYAAVPVSDVTYVGEDLNSQLADQVQAVAQEHGVRITFAAALGDPVVVLTEVANEYHADLIVVGASNRAFHRLFGSVAVRSIRTRLCPVTVVP